ARPAFLLVRYEPKRLCLAATRCWSICSVAALFLDENLASPLRAANARPPFRGRHPSLRLNAHIARGIPPSGRAAFGLVPYTSGPAHYGALWLGLRLLSKHHRLGRCRRNRSPPVLQPRLEASPFVAIAKPLYPVPSKRFCALRSLES